MKPFDYLAVVTSIVLGLGITQLMTGVGQLLVIHNRVQSPWIPLAWVLILLLAQLEFWWWHFGLASRQEWRFFSFLLLLASPVLMYLLSVLIFPKVDGPGPECTVNWFDHHAANRHWFFALAIAVLAVNTLEAMSRGDKFFNIIRLSHSIWAGLFVVAMLVQECVAQAAVAVGTLVLLLLFIRELREPLR